LAKSIRSNAVQQWFQVGAGDLQQPGLEGRDPAGGEDLVDQPAHPGVLRRVHGHEGEELLGLGAPEGLLDPDPVPAGEAPVVAERGEDVGVPGEGPEPVLLVVVDGSLLPQPRVERVRVFVDREVERAVTQLHRRTFRIVYDHQDDHVAKISRCQGIVGHNEVL
jgi:hypothetical protein